MNKDIYEKKLLEFIPESFRKVTHNFQFSYGNVLFQPLYTYFTLGNNDYLLLSYFSVKENDDSFFGIFYHVKSINDFSPIRFEINVSAEEFINKVNGDINILKKKSSITKPLEKYDLSSLFDNAENEVRKTLESKLGEKVA